MATTTETPDVYELTEGWNFNIAGTSATGTRTYLETTEPMSVATIPLPKIGDAWDTDWPFCTLQAITVSLVNNNENCGKKYTCNYASVINLQTALPSDVDELPVSVDVGGELVSWTQPEGSNAWKWVSDDVAVPGSQPLFRKVSTATIRITRVVKDFQAYMATVMDIVNYVNLEPDLLGFPEGALLFTGVNLTQFYNKANQKRWKAELNFVARKIIGPMGANVYEWGWTQIMRDDTGKWDIPVGPGGVTLYTETLFKDLFESDALGDDEDLYPVIPTK